MTIEYFNQCLCVKCEQILTFSQVMDSRGTCPKCGNTNNSTVVDYIKRPVVRITTNPLWKFWAKRYRYMWADDFKIEQEQIKK